MVIIRIMVNMHIILIISLSQVRIDLGLADHVWQNKRAAIAQEVDGLGPHVAIAQLILEMKKGTDLFCINQYNKRYFIKQ